MEAPSKFSMLSTRSSNACCSVLPKDSMPWMSESSVLSVMAGLVVVAALVFLAVAVCSAGLVPVLAVGLLGLAPALAAVAVRLPGLVPALAVGLPGLALALVAVAVGLASPSTCPWVDGGAGGRPLSSGSSPPSSSELTRLQRFCTSCNLGDCQRNDGHAFSLYLSVYSAKALRSPHLLSVHSSFAEALPLPRLISPSSKSSPFPTFIIKVLAETMS